MKILAICSAIDLKYKGCGPAWWQLLKGLHEMGTDVVVVPFYGGTVDSLWWKSYENPFEKMSITGDAIRNFCKKIPYFKKYVKHGKIFKKSIDGKWTRYLIDILNTEKDVDRVIVFNVGLNWMRGLPTKIKKEYDTPIIYFDGDMPDYLPKHIHLRKLSFSHYTGADLTEYDAFIVNSKGIVNELIEMGARKVFTSHYGADPSVFSPINIEKDIDIFYYGHGGEGREKWIENMITYPSKKLTSFNFTISGNFNTNLGRATNIEEVSFYDLRKYCCRSKINLNITRKPHAEVYATSTARLFELASMGCCIVSHPINGLNEWFNIGKEVHVVHSMEEAVDMYEWLISSDEVRTKTGTAARERFLKEHTYKHRAEQLLSILRK